MQTIAIAGSSGIQDDLIASARNLSMLLRNKELRALVINIFDAVRESYPDSRERLRRVIADILYRERKYWKQLSSDDLQALEALHARYEDASLSARLRQFVGQASWDRDEQIDLTPLAIELFRARPMFAADWPWLTSGQASDAWRLGQALATVDQDGELEDILPALEGRGSDLRLICGYVHRRRELNGTEWLERWMTKQLQRRPTDMPLLFEVTWRCGATVNIVREIIKALRQQNVDANLVGQLAFGTWSDELPTDVMIDLVQTLSDRSHLETAITILEHRLSAAPEELEVWDEIALKLVLNGKIIRSREMTSHYWNKLASRLAPRHAGAIAAAILREHADRTADTWFLEFSEARVILQQTIEHDASGVWEAIKQYLSSGTDGLTFSIGFPRGVVDRLPREQIWNWVADAPEKRAKIMAGFVAKDFSNDNTLAALIIGTYGDIEKVGSAFFSEYLSGGWAGSSSDHWNALASCLDEVAHRTSLPKLRRWATDAARSLRQMAERDRQREEED